VYVDHVAADGAFSDLADERVGAGDPIERLRVIDAERARQHDTAGLLAFSALTAVKQPVGAGTPGSVALLMSFARVADMWADAAAGALAARSTRVGPAVESLSASTSQQCHRGRSKDTSSDSLEDLPPRNGDGRRPRQIVKLSLTHRRSPSVTTVSILGSVVARCRGCPAGCQGALSRGGARLRVAQCSWFIAHLRPSDEGYLLAVAACVRACSPWASARMAAAPATTCEAIFPLLSTSTAIGVPSAPNARPTVTP
jgi:hypothetical protein